MKRKVLAYLCIAPRYQWNKMPMDGRHLIPPTYLLLTSHPPCPIIRTLTLKPNLNFIPIFIFHHYSLSSPPLSPSISTIPSPHHPPQMKSTPSRSHHSLPPRTSPILLNYTHRCPSLPVNQPSRLTLPQVDTEAKHTLHTLSIDRYTQMVGNTMLSRLPYTRLRRYHKQGYSCE